MFVPFMVFTSLEKWGAKFVVKKQMQKVVFLFGKGWHVL